MPSVPGGFTARGDALAGADIAIAQGFYLNVDFRHMQLATNLKDVNTKSFIVDANMTPNLYSVGIGYRF